MNSNTVMIVSNARRGVALALALAVAGLAPASAIGHDAELLKNGEKLLEKNCKRCHAIGQNGKSSHFKAPPFREVFKRYPAQSIEEALAEGIVSGHPGMPEFVFEPAEIDAIIAYLDSLSAHPENRTGQH
jgi:cytochrome c